MLIVIALAEVSAESLAALRDAAAAMTAASSNEQGCLSYSFNFDLSAPHLVRIVEVWRDQAALDAHFQTSHMAAFRAAIAGRMKMLSADVYETQAPRTLLR